MSNLLPFQKYEGYYIESFYGYPLITKRKLKKKCPCPQIKKEIYHADIIIPKEEIIPEMCCKTSKPIIMYNVDDISQESNTVNQEVMCDNYDKLCMYTYDEQGKYKLDCARYNL